MIEKCSDSIENDGTPNRRKITNSHGFSTYIPITTSRKNYFIFNNIGGGVNSFSFCQIKGREVFFVPKIYREGGNFNEAGVIKLLLASVCCLFFENYHPLSLP